MKLTHGGCGRNLGLPYGVGHVLVRGANPRGAALHQAREASGPDYSSARIPDEERTQKLACGVRAAGRPDSEYVRQPKFSDSQKKVAVDHYFEHGRCLALTAKALRYPSKTLLSVWVQERDPPLRTRVVGRTQPLPPEVKRSAVIASCMRSGSAESAAQQVGVSRQALNTWKSQLLRHDTSAPMERQKDQLEGSERAELEQQLEALRQDIRQLQIEQDLLKKANELLRKDLGIDQHLLTNREKTQLVDALRPACPLSELLRGVGLPRTSYFYDRARLAVADKYAEVRRSMSEIFESNYRCYDYRRIHASLSRQSVNVSEKVVRRLKKQKGLIPVGRKRRRYGSYMGEISPAPDNLLNRNFSADTPNEKWLTGITEFQILAGRVYLSPMIDCFDGMVVSWSIGKRPDADLVNSMLDAAIETVPAGGAQPMVHSDRGGHYRWPGWLSRIAQAKLVRSMSRMLARQRCMRRLLRPLEERTVLLS